MQLTLSHPVLLYRDGCAKCRLLSWLMVAASLGAITRLPVSSPLAGEIVQAVPAARGKLVWLDGATLVTGWQVIPSALWHLLRGIVHNGVR
jgi:hypothetical protein